jgi:L-2-hydroxyglutarate oxidase LhgO
LSHQDLHIDVGIVGGGILGLWSAHALLKKNPGLNLVVFEAMPFLGEHTTGRNSEVLHSGLYYPEGSLKHVHSLLGNQLWRKYISEKNMSFLDCGKVVVAAPGQAAQLNALYARGQQNSVVGMRKLNATEIQELQAILQIEDGFFIASSGVLNVSNSLKCLQQDVEALGGIVMKNCKVEIQKFSPRNFELRANGDLVHCSNLVNVAGLFAIDFRRSLGLMDFENYYVKGSYLKLSKNLPTNKLIYPLPPANGLGLGVHLTLDTQGGQKFGPNTEVISDINYAVEDSLIEQMLPAIHEIFKNVGAKDLQLGYAGVRPKVKKSGTLMTDFVFQSSAQHGLQGYYEFLGIESPGLTAAPSLAELLAERLFNENPQAQ